MNTQEVMRLARKYVSNDSSRLCLSDAVDLSAKGDYVHAKARALRSLSHSVGVFSTVYKAATA